MYTDNDLLLMSAARLYNIGLDVECARERLRSLVEQGFSYSSPEMLDAYSDFKESYDQWQMLEAEHLKLRHQMFQAFISRL